MTLLNLARLILPPSCWKEHRSDWRELIVRGTTGPRAAGSRDRSEEAMLHQRQQWRPVKVHTILRKCCCCRQGKHTTSSRDSVRSNFKLIVATNEDLNLFVPIYRIGCKIIHKHNYMCIIVCLLLTYRCGLLACQSHHRICLPSL